jgi:hypothetical protein
LDEYSSRRDADMTSPGLETKTSVLVLMTLLTLSLVACGAAGEVESTPVTGTETCQQLSDQSTLLTYECQDTTSDERVSGTLLLSVRLESSSFPTAMDGDVEITNDVGTWQGSWTGEITAAGNHIAEGVLRGAGGYEGLQYRARWEGVDYPWTVTGTIETVP